MLAYTKLFTIILLGTATLASANPSGNSSSVRVRSSDIDITSVRGRKILELRVDRAAREVCDFANDRLDHQVRKIERKCREDAKASAWVTVRTHKVLVGR